MHVQFERSYDQEWTFTSISMNNRSSIFAIISLIIVLILFNCFLFSCVVQAYYQRSFVYLMLQDRHEVFENARLAAESSQEKLTAAQAELEPLPEQPYLVISIVERRLWLKKKGVVLFTAQVATGSGKTLVNLGGANIWKFDTPQGLLEVQEKVEAPIWVPPDWYYVETSKRLGASLVYLEPGQILKFSDGSTVRVQENQVVRHYPKGNDEILLASEQHNIVLDGKLLVPPIGSTARRYKYVLGPFSLELGDGYAVHGTDDPASIGHAVSHGCVRMHNEDITRLFPLVPTGTPVYIY